ncbi:Protein kinase domain/Protein tyrosine kinase, putative [Angomonas deanei]|uniref:Protein kinase domain/Protein tyrosine kinase, putative n=1 Tax=Angomonas deanei TaxID=59799 RepID=A0A7G2C9X0_9TRYP|nr:Protein kinase domain/Protein tyrosine kinase, putative [Angomonas deanei]
MKTDFNEFLVKSGSWDTAIKKQFVYPQQVHTVEHRVGLVAKNKDLQTIVIPYKSVSLTPLYLKLEADQTEMDPTKFVVPERGVSESEARPIVQQLARHLALLHSSGIVHGYMQLSLLRQHSSNLLLLGHCLPLSLFVLNSPFAASVRETVAPEVGSLQPFEESADVWSVGVVLLQLLTKPDTMFCTDDLVDMELLSPWLAPLSASAKTFIMKCFKKDPAQRPTMVELLQHPFLSQTTGQTQLVAGEEQSDATSVASSEKAAVVEESSEEDDEEEATSEEDA